MKRTTTGCLAMASANIMWGLMSPVAKLAMASSVVAPLLMTDFRIFGAAALFWVASLFTRKEHVPRRDLLHMAGAAMLGILCNQGCFIFGVGYTSPGEASIITTMMPLWVMVFAALIHHEPVTWRKILGIVLGASGALILISGSNGPAVAGDKPMLGDSLILTAQISYALYLTFYKNFIRRYSLFTLMKWMFLFASIGLLPISATKILATQWELMGLTEILGSVFVVVGGTFIAYICMMHGQQCLRPVVVGMFNYMQPIVATIIGIWLGLDLFTPLKGVAVVLIFSGVYLVVKHKERHSAAPEPDKINVHR